MNFRWSEIIFPIQVCPKYLMGHTYTKKSFLFFWNQILTGCHAFLFAKSGDPILSHVHFLRISQLVRNGVGGGQWQRVPMSARAEQCTGRHSRAHESTLKAPRRHKFKTLWWTVGKLQLHAVTYTKSQTHIAEKGEQDPSGVPWQNPFRYFETALSPL